MLPRPSTREVLGSLARIHQVWDERAAEPPKPGAQKPGERKPAERKPAERKPAGRPGDADGGIDSQVRSLIEQAIALQSKDPDLDTHEEDREVLSALHQALEAQLRDEATDTPSAGGR